MNDKNNTQLAVTDKQFFTAIQEKFIQVSNKRTFDVESSFAMQILHGNSYLQKVAQANKTSLLKAVMNIAQCGLTLNPIMKLAYLVPMDGQVVLMPSYRGLSKLITDTGSVVKINSQLVYKGDDIEISTGSETYVKHVRKFETKNVIGCFALAVLKGGLHQVEFMDVEELHQVRSSSAQYQSYEKRGKKGSCIWADHEGEMMRKTVIKRLTKQLPISDERVNRVIDLDDRDYTISDSQRDFIDALLEHTEVPEHIEKGYLMELPTASPKRASEIIEEIKSFQPKSLNEQYKQIVLANPSTQIK